MLNNKSFQKKKYQRNMQQKEFLKSYLLYYLSQKAIRGFVPQKWESQIKKDYNGTQEMGDPWQERDEDYPWDDDIGSF